MSETIRVLVGWDEGPYVYGPVAVGEADGISTSHEVEIPAELWERHKAAGDEWDAVVKEIAALAKIDPESGLPLEVCPEWEGHKFPGRTWWEVVLDASTDPEKWPVRDVCVSRHFETPMEAEEWLASLPDELQILAHGYLAPVAKSQLRVERHHYDGHVGSCDRCGRERLEHHDVGTPK